MHLIDHPAGGYRFLTGIAPYSAGVNAAPGYAIVRRQLIQPLPLAAGFDTVARHLDTEGRPRAALCAIELRIPAPLSFDGFAGLNRDYQATLAAWGLMVDGRNPIARTNVAPALAAPPEPSLYAFCYTLPVAAAPASFVVAGAGDLHDQADLRPEAIVRPGETSAEALLEKAQVVMHVMSDRLAGLGATWDQVTAIDVYTAHSLAPLVEGAILPKLGGAALHGVHWYYSRPPIAGLEFEMDLRCVWQDGLLA
jgi:hypothetical protein